MGIQLFCLQMWCAFHYMKSSPLDPEWTQIFPSWNGKVKCLFTCLYFKVLIGVPVAFLVADGRKTDSKPRESCQGPLFMPGPEYKQMPCTCPLGQLDWDVWQGCLLPNSFPRESPGERLWASGFHWLTNLNDMMSHPSAGRLTTKIPANQMWRGSGWQEGNMAFHL